MGKILVALHY